MLGILSIGYSEETDQCERYYKKETQQLVIPEFVSCAFSTSQYQELNLIQINGELIIDDNVTIQLKFRKLSFGQNGKLYVGKTSLIKHNLIFFEQIGSDSCDFTQIEGKIYINSIPYKSINYKQNGARFIYGIVSEEMFIYHQNLILINTQHHEYLQQFMLKNTPSSSNYFLDAPINTEAHPFNQNTHIKFLIPDTRKTIGVIFHNVCISSRIEKLNGALFLNTRGLNLVGNQIQNCLFKDTTQEISPKRMFKFNSTLTDNIFLNLTSVKFQIEGKQLQDNTFLQVKEVYFQNLNFINKVIFVDSEVNLVQDEQIRLIIYNSHFINSTILHQSLVKTYFVNVANSSFIISSKYIFIDNVEIITIQDSVFSDSFIQLQKQDTDLIIIENSLIQCYHGIAFLKTFKDLKENQKLTTITLNNIILDQISQVVFEQFDCDYCNPVDQLGVKNIYYFIIINNVTIHYKQEDAWIFGLPLMQILIIGKGQDDLKQIIYSQTRPPYSTLPQLNYIQNLENLYEIPYQVTYFTFLSAQSIQGIDIEDFHLLHNNQLIKSQTFYPIFSNQTIRIDLTLPLQNTVITNLKIQLINQKEEKLRTYPRVIQLYSQRAIKSFTVVIVDNQRDLDDMEQCSRFIDWKFKLQFIELSLQQIPCDSITFSLIIDYCPTHLKKLNDECVETCPIYSIGNYCSDECPDGYYQSIIVEKNCFECQEYCNNCGSYCKVCPSHLVKSNKKCVFNCNINQFQIGDQCFDQ